MTGTAVVERVEFRSETDTLVGDLHLPADSDDRTRHPAVVVAGSWTTVKEQMAGRYAEELARRGFAALAFDFSGYGDSGGEPRDVESPRRKIRDVRHAIDCLHGHAKVDPAQLGVLGVCAGAGYVALGAAGDARVRAMALVAPWLHNAELVAPIYGGAQEVAARIERGRAAHRSYGTTGQVEYVPAVSMIDPLAAMYGPFDYYLDPDRGAIPQWHNRFALMAWPEWLRFDPISAAGRVTAPTLIVHSRDAAIPEGAQRFFDGLTVEKELTWLSGNQFDFYDQPSSVTPAVDAVAAHFRRY